MTQTAVQEGTGRHDRIHGDESRRAEFTDAELIKARNDLADDVLRGETAGAREHRLADVLEAQSDPETLASLLLKLRNGSPDEIASARIDIRDTLETWARNYFEGSDEVAERAQFDRNGDA